MPIGEVDLHRRHGVLVARILAELVAIGRHGAPVDGARVDLRAVPAVEHPDAELVEQVRVLEVLRNDVLAHDADRRVPVGIEVQLVYAARDRRRRPVGHADDDIVARAHAAPFDRLELGPGDVDHDIALAQVHGMFLHPGQIGPQRLEPGGGGNIERGDRLAVEPPMGVQAMVALEAGHRRLDDLVVVVVVLHRLKRQEALRGQTDAQIGHQLVPGTARQGNVGHRQLRPAAAPRHDLVTRDGVEHQLFAGLVKHGPGNAALDDLGARRRHLGSRLLLRLVPPVAEPAASRALRQQHLRRGNRGDAGRGHQTQHFAPADAGRLTICCHCLSKPALFTTHTHLTADRGSDRSSSVRAWQAPGSAGRTLRR
jgi:hypothetical protein